MLMILRFNRPLYLKAAVLSAFGILAASEFNGPARVTLLLAVAFTLFWIASSLVASWWFYDRAKIFKLNWLTASPGRWLNLHAGLDEIDSILKARFPGIEGQTHDIFDPIEVTEPALRHARRLLHHPLARQTNWRYLPAGNQTFDTC